MTMTHCHDDSDDSGDDKVWGNEWGSRDQAGHRLGWRNKEMSKPCAAEGEVSEGPENTRTVLTIFIVFM